MLIMMLLDNDACHLIHYKIPRLLSSRIVHSISYFRMDKNEFKKFKKFFFHMCYKFVLSQCQNAGKKRVQSSPALTKYSNELIHFLSLIGPEMSTVQNISANDIFLYFS